MLLRVTLVCKRAEHIGLSVAVDRETVSAREAAQMWGGGTIDTRGEQGRLAAPHTTACRRISTDALKRTLTQRRRVAAESEGHPDSPSSRPLRSQAQTMRAELEV